MRKNCGGCEMGGRHARWCEEVVGRSAAMRGRWSERAEAFADEVGSNEPELANTLYSVASRFRVIADSEALGFQAKHGTSH